MLSDYRKEKIRIEILDSQEEKEHFHQDIELLYILEGSLNVSVGDKKSRLMPEDILLINAEKEHYLQGTDDLLYMKLSIEYSMISDILSRYDIIFWCDSSKSEEDAYDELRKMLRRLLGHYLSTKAGVRNFAHIAMCYQIVDFLCMHFLVRASDEQESEEEKYQARINMINNYIRTNYDKPISLRELSEKLYLSNGYLSRFFKKNYHMSFMEYLTKVRLYHAVDALLYTDLPITRIAFDTGFASVTVFNRAFKEEYHETPSAVRKRAAGKKTEKDAHQDLVVTERLEKYLWQGEDEVRITDAADNEPKKIHAETYSPIRPSWNQIINIGAAKELLRSEVQEHLLLLQEGIGFQYARFWNPFSEAMLIDARSEEGDFNFSRIDSALDYLIGSGWIPFIELASKPRRIQKNQFDAVVHEEESERLPVEQWQRLIHVFICHLIRRYEDISAWRFELWFDDRLLINDAEIEQYVERFQITYKEIKKVSPGTEVGGCGIHTYTQAVDDKSFYIQNFLQKWILETDDDLKPDFISAYNYSYDAILDNGKFVSRRASDMEYAAHAIRNLKMDLKKAGLEDIKVYVTEWNLSVSDRNYINDSCFKGAYIVKNYIDTYDTVDAIAFFSGSDRISEHYDSNKPLFGGNGLLTRNGVFKPSAFAYQFLNRLHRFYVDRGSNHILTTDGNGNYTMLCHNCKELNYNYYYVEEDQIEKEKMAKYFEDLEPVLLKYEIEGMSEPEYHIKTHRVNEKNGSCLSLWEETNFEKELSRNDIRHFRRVCEPRLQIQYLPAKDGVLSLEIPLQANEIVLVRIIKPIKI